MTRTLPVLCLLMVTIGCSPQAENIPSGPSSTSPDTTVVTDSSLEFQEPSVPVSGGSGLPQSEGSSMEEVDCENAEDLCDSGEWACDDIADYCDIGPDDGSELPDDWDWDQ